MELGTFIAENLDALLADWTAFARTLPPCRDLTDRALHDHAAAMLRVIAEDLSTAQSDAQQRAKSHGLAARLMSTDTQAEEHGQDRFTLGFGLEELVAEFRALRASVIRLWTARRGAPTVGMLDELVRFNEAIDQAIAESLSRFVSAVRERDAAERQRREADSLRLRSHEARARRAEQRLDIALAQASMAYWDWNPESDQMSASWTIRDLFGLRPDQSFSASRRSLSWLHPQDRDAYLALTTQAREAITGWQTRFRIVRPCDGGTVWLEERAVPIADAEGRVYFTGLVWDVTAHVAADEARRRTEQTFVDLIEFAPFGVYAVDAQLRISHMNQGARTGAFRNVVPVVGRDLGEALHVLWSPAVAGPMLQEFRRTLRSGDPYFSSRFVSRRADIDAVQSYEWELHRVTLPDGGAGVVCYFYDSTLLRSAEEAARQADRSKDRFLATLAHELRNPLAPIRHATAIARTPGTSGAKVLQSLEVIDRQAARMALLLDDLLDVSRITRGRLALHPRPVAAAEVVRTAVETVMPLVEQRQHTLRVELPPEPLVLEADPLRLSQVLANLLANAARYSEPGGEITLSVAQRGDLAEMRVSDRGIGIVPEQIETVFEMFGQGEAPAELKAGGLGVGLALARRLVEVHGGSLHAQSEGPGQGAEFVVRLPMPAQAPARTQATPDGAPDDAASPETLLVIDDNVDAADSLAELLRLRGHEVRKAYGGEEGLACAKAFRPAVVLLDLDMPGMDGYEVARRLRSLQNGHAFTIVAVSGWGHADDRQRIAVAGIDYHLNKPLEEEKLRPALAQAQRRRLANRT